MRKVRGFTIVELIAVLTIVGILAAVAAPKFIGSDAFEARGAYGTLQSALRLAQNTAIAQRTLVYAQLNTSTRVVTLCYDAACTTGVIDPATKAAYSKTLPSSVTLTASANPIIFNGLGQETSNTTVTITLQNNVVATEPARSITIEPQTGYVY
ncbi:MAG TPA: GspH/FimT family protein [Methylophilaceae bacterium]|jgi:MSHA pilin protein MshC